MDLRNTPKKNGIIGIAKAFLDSDTGSAKLSKIILAALAMSAFITVTAIAPNSFLMLAPFARKKKYSGRSLYNSVQSLRRRGKIKIVWDRDQKVYKMSLTKDGHASIQTIMIDTIRLNPQKKWDGEWRIVLYDIPIRFKKGRNAFRLKIQQLGFYQLQKSVWVYPYPCEQELLWTAEYFGVTSYVNIMHSRKIMNAQKILKHFGLSAAR